jgi:hypothetical protein
LWKDKEAAVFLTTGQRYYDVGPSIQATNGDWAKTTVATDSTSTTLVLTTVTPTGYSGQTFTIAASDYVGVEVSGTLEWFTASSISSPNVTLSSALSGTAEAGNSVFIYRNRIEKPLKIYSEDARLWQNGSYELPLNVEPWSDYNLLPDKTAQGTPSQVAYQPKIDDTRVAIWPTTSTCRDVLLFRYQAPIEIFNTSATTQEMPSEWIRVLAWCLAAESGPAFSVPLPRQQYLDTKAAGLYESINDWDQDTTSIYLQPEYRGR